MGSGGVAIAALPTVTCLKVPFSDGLGGGSPTIGNNVVIGAGAVVVGRITIGDSAFIGANAYVYQDIPENAVVGAMPGKILSYNGTKGYFGH